ncbi:pyrroline-5-carboxylate reductase [Alloscardovia macacae]|uniref:Pyrroline-5-carboxylate reductase n=1 Tax=Alloscardovia macacae TaxID=1160091 RepID=A0A1Y2SZ47_9BIFI|nr:pyrroline-5-carboxylate reductase [Alloscardovia macacae]OTA27121.1 pyrroline-5-carboxylate reductase [Alloscardovia macacae]OTA29687.1 pyrroline-5-carboxylate reductase [Alloscardovia macacae]
MTTVGFLGFGNMATAIVDGWRSTHTAEDARILACAAHFDALQDKAQQRGVEAVRTARDVVDAADVIIVAVKPYQIEGIFSEFLADVDWSTKLVISLAAGKLNSFWSELLPDGARHISTIPNTPIAIGQGVVVAEDAHTLTDADLETVRALFEPISTLEFVDSAHVSVAGTLAGCGPAYAAMFMEALADAGVKYGLQRATAYRLAAGMIAGTGALQLSTGLAPAVMKDAVCSPGGTTIQGVAALEQTGFRGSIISAIDAVESSR